MQKTSKLSAVQICQMLMSGASEAHAQTLVLQGTKKDLGGEQSRMFFEVIRLLKERVEHQKEVPAYLIMENVKNLLSSNGGWDFAKVQIEMDKAGYDVEWNVFNSAEVVPQNRERVYIIGHLRGTSTRKVFPIIRQSETDDGQPEIDVIGNTSKTGYRSHDVVSDQGISKTLTASEGVKVHSMVGVHNLGHYGDKRHQSNQVIGDDGVARTLSATDYKHPQNIGINVVGNVSKTGHHSDDVMGEGGISKTITAQNAYKHTPKVAVHQVGQLRKTNSFGGNPQTGRVYGTDGVSPTLNTMQGGGREPKVLVKAGLTSDRQGTLLENVKELAQQKRPNTKVGVKVMSDGDVRAYKQDARKSGIQELQVNNPEGKANAVTSAHSPKTWAKDLRIRKLTPLECWRLQGFDDDQFYKAKEVGVSNSQLYKQAGNAVTVPVVEAIAEKLGID